MLLYLNGYGGLYGIGMRISESVGVLLTDPCYLGKPVHEEDLCYLTSIGERLFRDQRGRVFLETEWGYVSGDATSSSYVSTYSGGRLMRVGGAGFDYYGDGKCMRVNGVELSYYCDGRLMRVGNAVVDYYGYSRVMRAGSTELDYYGDGRIMRAGSINFDYYSDGRIMRVGYTSF